jgi:hypothetical protein
MGLGLPSAPDKITQYNDGIVVAYDDRDGRVELQVWNGHFWNKIATPNIPRTGLKPDGEFKVLDLLSINGEILLAVGYENRDQLTDNNIIIKWANGKWTDISSSTLSNATSLKQLFIEDNTIKCLGKFSNNGDLFNILSYENGSWIPEGNAITKASYNETFKSAVYHDNVLYATGNFSNPSSPKISLATWDGYSWRPANYPPFLGENITLGHFEDNVVMYGKSDFTTSKFKINRNGIWQDISSGLDNIIINQVEQFAELNNNLFALGKFSDTIIKENYNLLVYTDQKWQPTKLNLSSIQLLHSWKESVILSGDFTDNSKLNYIGEVFTDRAQITARVFNDINANCIKDTGESWLSRYPIKVDNIDTRFQTDNSGQLYLHVDKKTHRLNAQEYQYYTPTCPDVIIEANENKTYYGTALGVCQKTGVSDVDIYISDNQGVNAIVGDRKTLNVCVNNIGSQPITNAELKINLSKDFKLISSQIPYQNIDNNDIIYTIDLSVKESICFEIVCNVTGLSNLIVKSSINLTQNTDQDISNNSYELEYGEGQTYANEKHCINGGKINPNDYNLRYKIGIQNTTNEEVDGITLVDELDPNIIVSQQGVEVTTSHSESKPITTYEYSRNESGNYTAKLITRWRNIQLTPKESDEESSKAFVDYSINVLPKSLDVGKEICNTALIYLSHSNGLFEEPKLTNTVCSMVEETLGVINNVNQKNIENKLSIGPNPADNVLNFINSSNEIINISLINSIGQSVRDFRIDPRDEKNISVKELPRGVYMVFSSGLFSKKIIIN